MRGVVFFMIILLVVWILHFWATPLSLLALGRTAFLIGLSQTLVLRCTEYEDANKCEICSKYYYLLLHYY